MRRTALLNELRDSRTDFFRLPARALVDRRAILPAFAQHDPATFQPEHTTRDVRRMRATQPDDRRSDVVRILSIEARSWPLHLLRKRTLRHARARCRRQRIGSDAVAPKLRGLHQSQA